MTFYLKHVFCTIAFILFANSTIAGNGTFSNKLVGSQISTGSFLDLQDDQFDDMVLNFPLWSSNFVNTKTNNYVHLKYTGSDLKHYTSSWFVQTILNIDSWDEQGNTMPAQQCTLKITFDPQAHSLYTDVSSFVGINAHKIKTTVLQVQSSFAGNAVPSDVILENVIDVERRLNMNAGVPIFINNTPVSSFNTNTYNNSTEMVIYWDYLFGADEYDLEWVFKSSFDLTPTIDYSNSTRITTSSQQHKINLTFDDGKIYYRIRGISKDFNSGVYRVEGDWTYSNVGVVVSNMEHRNWTYNSTYAEQGKKKEVVTYFDGSQKDRQSVTLSNTEDVTLIAEGIYDYEGRKAIQTLPAPSKDYKNNLLFYQNLNLNQLGQPYTKKDFDNNLLYVNCTLNSIPGMLSNVPSGSGTFNMGASYYYSDQNVQALTNGFNVGIPDADDYPFSHTVFSNTGKPKSQSGLGVAFRSGSDHETQYLEATASQEKLDRLFGNEVGYAEHYNEKISIDPNGQISVSYENLSGQVIATAMRGDSPLNLKELNSSSPANDILGTDEQYMLSELIKEDFSGQNNYIGSSETFEIIKDFPVTNISTAYTFAYEITPQVFHALCNDQYYNCKYKLEISIVDDCGSPITETSANISPALNTIHDIDVANYTSSPFQLNFTVNFNHIGVYKIIKKLYLDPVRMQQSLQAFEADLRDQSATNITCIDKLADLEGEFEDGVDMTECNTCEQNAGIESELFDGSQTGTDANGNIITFADKDAYLNYLLGLCVVEPDEKTCDALLLHLKDDMSPDGQYFEYTGFDGTTSYPWGNGTITPGAGSNYINILAYINSSPPPNSNNDFIIKFAAFITANGCNQLSSGVTPATLYAELKNNWDPCWADFLVQYHPEYCRYNRCKLLTSSYDYNAKLLSLDYNNAKINPTTSSPYLDLTQVPVGMNVFNNDPFFQTIAPNYPNNMVNEINSCPSCSTQFQGVVAPLGGTMWDWATLVPTPLTVGAQPAQQNFEHWRNFVALYLSFKSSYEKDFEKILPNGPQICPALLDNSTPPDNITEANSQIFNVNGNTIFVLNGMQINDPEPLLTVNYLTPDPIDPSDPPTIDVEECFYTSSSFTFGDGGVAKSAIIGIAGTGDCDSHYTNCTAIPPLGALTSGMYNYVLYARIPNYPANYPTNMSAVAGSGCFVQISDVVSLPISNAGLTSSQINGYLAQLKNAIDTYVSTPYDFTCDVNYATSGFPLSYSFYIKAPTTLGPLGNGIELKVVRQTLGGIIQEGCPAGKFSGAQKICDVKVASCFCAQLTQIFNAYDEKVGGVSVNGINYTTYPTFEDYAAHTLNNAYSVSPALVAASISFWYSNCKSNSYVSAYALDADGEVLMSDPGNMANPVPPELNCDADEPCQEQGMEEADFYAAEEHESQIQEQLQNFIQEYKAKCLNKAALMEKFNVQYTEKEYHYTLYYYDQAGNLVRTVPPKAVNRIDAANLYSGTGGVNIVNEKRLLNQANPLSTNLILPGHDRYNTTSTNSKYLLVTNYKYNTFNKLVEQETPDGGKTNFWYNDIGMLRFSQNAKQKNTPCTTCGSDYIGMYSYTIYDAQGRIKEVGENYMNNYNNLIFYGYANSILFPVVIQSGTQVTKTYYDTEIPGNPVNVQFTGSVQQLLRSRVATTTYEDVDDNDDNTYDHATHYSYDVHGNVVELVQENPTLASINQQYKKTQYKFDLVSGKVNEVNYQLGQRDQFHHRYYYDADNRIRTVYTSNDYIHWQQDARYFYYLHGPLARVEIGDDKVQGNDYNYTMQGWIKTMNTNTLQNFKDVGADSYSGYAYIPGQTNAHKNVAHDIYGYSLEYFANDYKAIKSSVTADITGNLVANNGLYNTSNDLYNGNIKAMATAMYQPNASSLPTQVATIAKFYSYDQLNRLQEAQSFVTSNHSFGGLTAHSNAQLSDYYEFFRYDENGNIKKVIRNAYTGAGFNNSMDNMSYNYATAVANNTLTSVVDNGDNSNLSTNFGDIKDQSISLNYEFDDIGNLVKDVAENIRLIEWTVYGKIKKIIRQASSSKDDLEFAYDASGNRIMKVVKPKNGTGGLIPASRWLYTYYSRDAQGNVMAVYTKRPNALGISTMYLTEHDIYGSSRIGLVNHDVNMQASVNLSNTDPETKGEKAYEISNHLGNVGVTISDRKLSVDAGPIDGVTDYYLADVLSATDYYSFGSPMPGRQFTSTVGKYRYGFQNQEEDPELWNGAVAFEYRVEDPRLGRFFSTDPLEKDYPHNSPYAFSENVVINAVELEGLEKVDLFGNTGPFTDEHLESQANDYLQKSAEMGNQPMFMEGAEGKIKEPFERKPTSVPSNEVFMNPENNKMTSMSIGSISLIDNGVGSADGIESAAPIWGSGRNAISDFQNGRYIGGTINGISAISDVFLVKSIYSGIAKGGLTALSKNYKNWSSYRSMYGKEGFAGRGQDVHHWLFEKGGKSGEGFGWWAKNQMFNLKPMNAMKFKGVTYEGAVIHQAMHGNSTILRLNSAEKVYMRIVTTPTWFKAGVGSAPGHIGGLLND